MSSATKATARHGGMRAVIFDMDGVLIDTEPVWRSVEISVFGSLGLHITEAECRQTMGMRVREVVQMRHDGHPWPNATVEDVTRRIVSGVADQVRAHGVAMDGVQSAVAAVRGMGLRCAVASSSPLELVSAVVSRLDMVADVDVVCSADQDTHGKPAPDIYLRTAALLELPPSACLAIEDSVNGVLSARAAGMHCIAIPDQVTADDPRLAAATLRLKSLRALDQRFLLELSHGYFA